MLINSSTDSNKMKHDFIPCGCELSFYKNQFYHVSSVDKGNLSLNSNLSSLIELISTSCFHPSAIVRSCEWPSSEEMYCQQREIMFYHVKSVDRIILVVHLYSVESLVVHLYSVESLVVRR